MDINTKVSNHVIANCFRQMVRAVLYRNRRWYPIGLTP